MIIFQHIFCIIYLEIVFPKGLNRRYRLERHQGQEEFGITPFPS